MAQKKKRMMPFDSKRGIYQGVPEPDNRTPAQKAEAERDANVSAELAKQALDNLKRNSALNK